MSRRRVFAIILAAGQSKRMGRPKQLLPYRGSTILDVVVDAVLESPLDGLVIVTTSSIAAAYEENLPERCYVATNDESQSEMIDSVRIGLRRLKQHAEPADWDGVMILLADQPQVAPGVMATCAETFRLPKNAPGILIATYKGRRGHPAIFSVAQLSEIEDWGADRQLNELARLHPEAVRELPITTCPMPIDVNTPDDYERLKG